MRSLPSFIPRYLRREVTERVAYNGDSTCSIPAGQAHSTRNESGTAAQVLWILPEK